MSIAAAAAGTSASIQTMLLLGLLALLPGLLLVMTSFTRILIVLGFVRNALGTQSIPPNQVLVGISLFLSLFVMAPTLHQVDKVAVEPYRAHKIDGHQAIVRGLEPVRTFMFKQTRDKDLALFLRLSHSKRPRTRADVPTHVLVPAFVISELTTAFKIGFLIYLPFLIIDMIVSATLMSMGMMMLPPVLISLPFKILLFVLVDGWSLIVQSLVSSFH
ncbi:MAG: flagellar biosynthesis protein FliP [Gaiellales bacterium]|nr:flagellar biosynthesis protein FliP [Gaiellales bacterium]MDX6599017.1 flagellar biosynthesis protein FliP [Gaiellales bacterium]